MTGKHIRTAALVLVLFIPVLIVSLAQASDASLGPSPEQAPFSVDVQPEKTTAKAGDSITYTMKITAQSDFSGSIKFELTVTALAYGMTLDLGTQNPPYPKEFQYTLKLPDDIPVDVTAKGVIKATSGSHVVQDEVEISLTKSGGGGGFLDWLIGMLQDIWHRILSIFGIS